MQPKHIYILKTIRLKPYTEKQIQKDYQSYMIQRNTTLNDKKDFPIETYKKILHSFNSDKFTICLEDNSYFSSMEDAITCGSENFADINDGGVFNYLVIVKLPVGEAYAFSNIQSIALMEYFPEHDVYILKNISEINKDEKLKFLYNYFSNVPFTKEDNIYYLPEHKEKKDR